MEHRVIVAFAVAPAVVPLVVVSSALANGVHVRESVVLGSIYAAFTYGTAVVFGVPAFVVFLRNGWSRWWQYTIAGGLIGGAVLFMFSALANRFLFEQSIVSIFVAIGAVSATVFWVIAVRDGRSSRGTLVA